MKYNKTCQLKKKKLLHKYQNFENVPVKVVQFWSHIYAVKH